MPNHANPYLPVLTTAKMLGSHPIMSRALQLEEREAERRGYAEAKGEFLVVDLGALVSRKRGEDPSDKPDADGCVPRKRGFAHLLACHVKPQVDVVPWHRRKILSQANATEAERQNESLKSFHTPKVQCSH